MKIKARSDLALTKNVKLKIIFLGTPRFGAIILEKLADTKYKPVLVITEPDKPAGRKQELKSPECKIIAEKYNIPVEQPEKITNYKLQITNYKPDLIIVAAYGQIIPKEILGIPKYGCVNIHPSLLPKYRGPSPIQAAILNQDKETGITIILMDEEIDHGAIISNVKIQMSIPQNAGQNPNYQMLETELAEKGAELLLETIPEWVAGKIKAEPQNEAEATFTKIIKKEDGKIDWKKSAKEIEAQIRAFHVWPAAHTFWNGKRIKILKAGIKELPNDRNYVKGKTVALPAEALTKEGSTEILVKCGQDFLIIKELQMEGGKPLNSGDFLKGHPDFIDSVLG